MAASGPDITEHRLGGARGYLGWGSQHCGPGTASSPPVSGSSLLAWTWFWRPRTVPPGVCVWGGVGRRGSDGSSHCWERTQRPQARGLLAGLVASISVPGVAPRNVSLASRHY